MSRNIKYTCGTNFPSGCVVYTGDLPAFISEDDVPCDVSLDELFEKYNTAVDGILAGIDLTDIDSKCFDFNPDTATVKVFAQEAIDKICTIETTLAAVQLSVNDLDIGAQVLTVDLGCLAPEAAPCEIASGTYTLASLIQLLAAEICLLKNS